MSSQHRPGRCRALIFPSQPRSWERTRCCGGSGRQHAFSMMGKQRALPDWTHVQHSSNNNRRNTESYSQYTADCKFFLNSIPLYFCINTIHPIRNTRKKNLGYTVNIYHQNTSQNCVIFPIQPFSVMTTVNHSNLNKKRLKSLQKEAKQEM